jgi:CMP-N,N'-diacetyllegionaminic acid synthase
MSILCTICARGGSKGVKNKNIMPILGKPLIAYTLQQAKKSGLFEYIAVSSDSDLILEAAGQWGADLLVKRPDEMAGDSAAKIPAIRHCVEQAEAHYQKQFETIIDLDVTSPLRLVADLIDSHRMFVEKQASNLITAAPARKSPYFNMVEVGKDGLVRLSKPLEVPVVRRQDAPACYDMNASIYIWTRESLFSSLSVFQERTELYVMPEDRSVDIDTETDLELVTLLLQKREDSDDELFR